MVDAVERDAAVVAHDAAAPVGVGKPRDDLVLSRRTHFGRIAVVDALVVRLAVFVEDLIKLCVGFVPVGAAGFLSHADAAVGHEGALQGLVGLDAHHLLEVLELRINVGRRVGRDRGDDFGLHVEDAALGAFFLLEFGESSPELLRCYRGAGEEVASARIRGVVVLNEVADVYVALPVRARKGAPGFSHGGTPLN